MNGREGKAPVHAASAPPEVPEGSPTLSLASRSSMPLRGVALPAPPRVVRERDAGSHPQEPILRVEFPLRTVSVNHREHHFARASRVRSQHEAVRCALGPLGVPHPPLDVFLTRIASKRLDDDNLAGSFKAIRDAIAKWLRVDDARRDLVAYHYAQELRAPGHWQRVFTRGGVMRKLAEGLVRIEIRREDEAT
jgi:hypothetical protein